MIDQKQHIFLLMCFYVLSTIPVAFCTPIIYVAGDGTGTYNCDGTSDQVEINQALVDASNHPGTTVYLKGPFVYDIENSCLIGSNTELTGDSTAKLRLHDNIGWTNESAGTPIVGQIGGYGTPVHDVSIHGFEIDGNEMNQSSGNLSDNGGGHDLYRIISFQGSSSNAVKNISCYNMNLHDSKGDGFRVKYGTNINVYSNTLSNLQHCCMFFHDVNVGSIHNNVENELCMSGIGLDDCQNIIVDSDSISPYMDSTNYPKDSFGNGYDDNGIQICNADSTLTSNVTIKNCTIKGGINAIFLSLLNDNCDVNIRNNTIHDSGYENEAVNRNGGIGINGCGNGITLQYNSITGSYNAGINVDSGVSGKQVTVANNDIMNGETGYAVKDNVTSNVSLVLTHNYIYGNPANFYPSSLVNTDPATSPNIPVLPVASFTASTIVGNTTSPITFTDTSTNIPISWSWNFGDNGINATTKNVSHKFSKAGIYTVMLTVKNAAGSASTSKTINIVAKPVASFTISPTSGGTTATTYTFTDTSANYPTTWNWNFGDGGTGSGKSITHTYSTAKTYTVKLTVGNIAGNATVTKSVVVKAAVKPVASFTVSPTSGTTATTFTFTDTSTNSPTTSAWIFGDGGTALGKTITHKFTKAGSMSVKLTTSNAVGSATLTKTVYVAAVKKPIASFSYSPTTVKHGSTITFTDKSTNSPATWKWTFSDTSTAPTTSKVTHVFSKAGSFKVTLLASNTAGSSTATKTITVS